MPKISVVIPCYKAKETIAKTLHSIAMQSIADDIEVIIVNDCDGLNYDDIMYNFPELNLRYITREKNGGCGAARNTGIKNAESDYIIFIDADDCFSNCLALEVMYNRIVATKSDMLVSVFESEMRRQDGILIKKMEHTPTWMHGKLLRRQYIIDNNLFYDEKMRINEDVLFNQIFIDLGAKIVEIPMITLMWKDNPNSVTHQSIYENKRTFILSAKSYIHESNLRGMDSKKVTLRVLQNLVVIYQYYNIVLDECPENSFDYLECCKLYWKSCEPIVKNVEDEYVKKVFCAVMKEYGDIPNITFVQFLDRIRN